MSTVRERFEDNDAVIFDVRLSDEELMNDIGTLLEMVDELVELHNTPDFGGPFYDNWKTDLLKRITEVIG